jgi:hypothetical protein
MPDPKYKLDAPKAMPSALRDKIAETLRTRPDLTHAQIAELHGAYPWQVGKVSVQTGLRRRDMNPIKPLVRKGIQISDRQMAARMGVKLEEYLERKGK